MKKKKSILKVLKRKGWHLVKKLASQDMPRGIDVFIDIRRFLPNLSITTVFDVGANIGSITKKFHDNYPEAMIYCFEPVSDLYQSLVANIRSHRIHCFLIALSDTESTGRMRRQSESGLFTLENVHKSKEKTETIEDVPLSTIDNFCQSKNVSCISYLKIDAGGHDYSVLKGGKDMFNRQAIDVVEVESGMNPDSPIFSRFEKMKLFLEERDYRLFAIYEQMYEFPTREPHLRRANTVFISRDVIRKNVYD